MRLYSTTIRDARSFKCAGCRVRGRAPRLGRLRATCSGAQRAHRRVGTPLASVGYQRGPTISSADQLREQLRRLGLADGAISAAWPRWWSDDAEASPSARAELRFAVARRLGLDPGSLLVDNEPRFLWRQEARFKHLSAEDEVEQAGIASFGRALATAIAGATAAPSADLAGYKAAQLRGQLLESGRPFIGLDTLLALSWGVGIPVVHLRLFPWPQKRMAAMTVRIGERSFVLLSKDASYPPWIAFYLAHELAHIALAHVKPDEAVVDLDTGEQVVADDDEESAADAWALELLTGRPRLEVTSANENRSASELARTALSAASALRIEPGTLALAFGHTTGDWQIANGSLKVIYDAPAPVWQVVNAYAASQMSLDEASSDAADFIEQVLALHELS